MSELLNQTVNHVIHYRYAWSSSMGESSTVSLLNHIGTDMANYLNEDALLWEYSSNSRSLSPLWQEGKKDAIFFHYASDYPSYGFCICPSVVGHNRFNHYYSYTSRGESLFYVNSSNIGSNSAENWITYTTSYSPERTFYLNLVKSKSGRSFAFSLTYLPTNSMVFLFAEDENNKFGSFLLAPKDAPTNTDYHVLYSSYGLCYNLQYLIKDNADASAAKGLITPYPMSFPGSVTSISKLANPFGGCYFKEVYSILSTPLNKQGIVDNSFLIDGKKFKGIGATTIMASSNDTHYRGLLGAGPFAMEVE